MREGFDNLQFTSQKRKVSLGSHPHQNPAMLLRLVVTKAVGRNEPQKREEGQISILLKNPGSVQVPGCTQGRDPLEGALTFDAWHREHIAEGAAVRAAALAPS